MTVQDYLSAYDLNGAMACLQAQIKNDPANVSLRLMFFQILCLQAKWDQAIAQLEILQTLSHEWSKRGVIFRDLVEGEKARENVFQGTLPVPLYGCEEEWIHAWIEGCRCLVEGKYEQTGAFFEQALAGCPQSPVKINDQECSWLSDADARLGPFIEAYLRTHYCWIPNNRVKKIKFSPVERYHDLVWRRAEFWLSDGLQTAGFVPVRYPGVRPDWPAELLMSARTEWQTREGGWQLGLGQRMWMTDRGDHPFLEVHQLELLDK